MSNSSIPYSIIVPTLYGNMILNRHDINQTNALVKTGMACDHAEILLLARLLDLIPAPDKKIFVDIGANVGTHTLGIAKHLGGSGLVYSFEPQRLMFQLICGTLALNSIVNVHCHHAAVGADSGIIEVPQFDYFQAMNFGSIEFGPDQKEQLHQQRGSKSDDIEFVSRVALDSFEWPTLHALKIDVEGMEFEVLDGARATLARCQPIILIEYIKVDRDLLIGKMRKLDCRLYDVWPNLLCIPDKYKDTINITGIQEV